jgi:hypothetical protein
MDAGVRTAVISLENCDPAAVLNDARSLENVSKRVFSVFVPSAVTSVLTRALNESFIACPSEQ